ncbi:hypothetical protein [Bifidobacterium oedipodis]|uniref:PASTA domain-containing protein n=1 Tax=Bifidobacterium oedipodis TaxID=2675322 RepID=A0A7Y0EP54_9BIFI|nr:hypothetical protein [Bifidobacterium sp. DSM 109957]NMM93757.1 hypothetical protein [Bifidobacterium sp. DSM 109957]
MRITPVGKTTIIAVLPLMLMSLSACGQIHTADAPTTSATSSSVPQSDGNDQNNNEQNDTNTTTEQAAQQYRDCLEDHGIPAEIVEGNRVVFQWQESDANSISESSNDTNRDAAIQKCQVTVPDYHDPNFNTK